MVAYFFLLPFSLFFVNRCSDLKESPPIGTLQSRHKAYGVLKILKDLFFSTTIPATAKATNYDKCRRRDRRHFKNCTESTNVIDWILSEGDPTFLEELSNFKEDSNPIAWDCAVWIRTYALFLEERLESFRGTVVDQGFRW
ncbi:unnamed protein product [Eruca vesicaria subsp. sativa]|uniref:AP180 N-terminal homology (ANTH) domain-containing protein n=1 Tax=Eruca vesicaria subsp. sativa TaxID=29727 RepID=A0ABC8KTF5_ERUVS|nr:unnamed protein product [Eruca vesicaria subsp. sativa]